MAKINPNSRPNNTSSSKTITQKSTHQPAVKSTPQKRFSNLSRFTQFPSPYYKSQINSSASSAQLQEAPSSLKLHLQLKNILLKKFAESLLSSQTSKNNKQEILGLLFRRILTEDVSQIDNIDDSIQFSAAILNENTNTQILSQSQQDDLTSLHSALTTFRDFNDKSNKTPPSGNDLIKADQSLKKLREKYL